MSIQSGLRTFLVADGTLQSLLSATATVQKVYVNQKPQSVNYPVLIISQLDKDAFAHLSGDTDLSVARFDFDALAVLATNAVDIRERVRVLLLQKDGGGTVGAEVVESLTISNEQDDWQRAVTADDVGKHIANLEAEIMYRDVIA